MEQADNSTISNVGQPADDAFASGLPVSISEAVLDTFIGRGRPTRKSKSGTITMIPCHEISETSENWQVYRQTADGEASFEDLCDSIAEHGIKSPLELSEDNYILSGHRR